jgi:hypothetical protein
MAGNWIKFDTSTSDKPEVWAIATQLSIDPDAVVGKLLRIWTWFDDHSEKGNAPSVTKALLDRRVGVTGFVTSMIEAGWMDESDGVLRLPNFERHNGQTAKNRALTAKRVSEHKKSNAEGNAKGNAPIVTRALPKEEKNREEKNTHTHTHQRGGGNSVSIPEEIATAWERWCNFRLSIDGREVNAIQAETVLMDLGRRGWDKAARDIDFSIRKGARSILDSDNDFESRKPTHQTSGRGFTT